MTKESPLIRPPLRILVAIDLEGKARAAAALALRLGRAFGSQVQAVHAASKTRRPRFLRIPLTSEEIKLHSEEARSHLPADWPASSPLIEADGDPAAEIQRVATESAADLLVLGGPSEGTRHRILGGTARDLLHSGPWPVLVCRGDAAEGAEKRLVVALDLNPDSEETLEYAITWSHKLGARLDIVYVFEPPAFAYSPEAAIGSSTVDHLREREFEAFRKGLDGKRLAGVPHSVRLEEGAPAEAIRRIAAESPSIVVMGTHGRAGLMRFALGSVAEAVLAGSAAPVLLVPLRSS